MACTRKKKESDKKYRDSHKTKRAEYQKVYRESHKEERKLFIKQYKESHKEEVSASKKAYEELHKNERGLYFKDYRLKRTHGITLKERSIMLDKQGGKCAICGICEGDTARPFCVDHDHKTGEIRGLLCHMCNVGLGYFNDDIDALQSAILYIENTTILR